MMDEPTLGDALRSRPPGDPIYRPGLSPERPGTLRPTPDPASARRGSAWAIRLATIAVVAMLAAGGVMVVGSMPSQPATVATPTPFVAPAMANGPIAYDREGDIWITEADGSEARALTTGVADDRAPSWSADGAWIAYWRGHGDRLELRAIHPDGTADRLVATGTLEDRTMAWVPWGGHRLAYVLRQAATREEVGPVVLVVALDRPLEPVPNVMPGTAPAWSPDGLSLAYLTSRADGRLMVVDTDSESISLRWPTGIQGPDEAGDPRYLPVTLRVADPPAWSPDSSQLAFAGGAAGDRDIVIASGRSVGARWSTTWDEWSPVWSPDGTRLAWLRDEALRTVIQEVTADGSSQSSPIQVDDNATAIVAAPDGTGWVVSRPGAIDLLVPRADGADGPMVSIDAPLSTGVVSWLGVRRLAASG